MSRVPSRVNTLSLVPGEPGYTGFAAGCDRYRVPRRPNPVSRVRPYRVRSRLDLTWFHLGRTRYPGFAVAGFHTGEPGIPGLGRCRTRYTGFRSGLGANSGWNPSTNSAANPVYPVLHRAEPGTPGSIPGRLPGLAGIPGSVSGEPGIPGSLPSSFTGSIPSSHITGSRSPGRNPETSEPGTEPGTQDGTKPGLPPVYRVQAV